MKVDQKLVDAALTFLDERHPNQAEGGVAAMYTESGKILLSTYAESPNEFASLCHETGAICEAHKLQEKITATVCVSRLKNERPIFLPPCGICQERLAFWGMEVSAAVPKDKNTPTEWKKVSLDELQPYYWKNYI